MGNMGQEKQHRVVKNMGKCSKCGKKIEYNSYRVVDGIVYCLNCTPEKEIDPEIMKAEEEATEQFLKDMAEVGEAIVPLKKPAEKKDMPEKLAATVKNSGVNFSELANALSTVDKKPRKKRGKKGKSE